MSWGPLAEGKNDFFNNKELKSIGEKYGKSVAQVALRYLYQRDIILIPKTVNKDRMAENINIFDFELTKEDMERIEKFDEKKPLIFDHRSPQMVEYLLGISSSVIK